MTTNNTFCKFNNREHVSDNLFRIYKSECGRYAMRVNGVNGNDLRISVWSIRGGSDNAIDNTPEIHNVNGTEFCFCAYRGKSIKFTADNFSDVENL